LFATYVKMQERVPTKQKRKYKKVPGSQGLGRHGSPSSSGQHNGGYGNPGSILGSLTSHALAEALEEEWKWEAGSNMMNVRENGNTNNLDDMFSFRLHPLLQHPEEGTELPQCVRIPESDL
jgi:hypothetical protein